MARSVGGITTVLAFSLRAQQQPPPTIRTRIPSDQSTSG